METTIDKCQCGHRSCNQYTLSTQRGIGFDLADAQLYAAAADLLSALKAMVLNDRHTYRDCHKAALCAIAKATTPESQP